MKIVIKVALPIFFLCLSLCCPCVASAERLFVLDDTGGVLKEYDIKDFRIKQTLQIPKDMYFKTKPEHLRDNLEISESGRILYLYNDMQRDGETLIKRLWYWDGKKEHRAEVSYKTHCPPSKDRCDVDEYLSEPFLDADDAVFYWAKEIKRFRYSPHADYREYVKLDVELYKVCFRAGKLDEELIARIPFKECYCATGACEETCPTSHFLIPEGGVKDLIEVEHFVIGQLGSSVEGHTYFEKKGGKWVKTGEEKKMEKPFMQIIYDCGCCSWTNDSSDMLLLIDGKKQKVIYDEWERFNNRNYDISFYISGTELSPDFKNVAYSIEPDEWAMNYYKSNGTFHLSADGKENTYELEKIMAILKDLPLVEIISVDEDTINLTVNKAELVGWIDKDKLLILKDNRLVSFDIPTRQFTELQISVKSIRQVYLR